MDPLFRQDLIAQHQQELQMEAAERRQAALIAAPQSLSVRLGRLLIVMGTALTGVAEERLEEYSQRSNEERRMRTERGAGIGHRVPPCHPTYNVPCTRSCPYSAFS